MQRIAIIDDVEANNILIKGYLTFMSDLEITCFTDPIGAISWCIEFEPDLVLLDYRMPEMDGLAFIRRFRSIERLKDTPVIMVTGDERRETLYEALKFGGTDFLKKPVDRLELIARTCNMLNLHRRQRDLKVANQQLLLLATTDSLTGLKNRRSFMEGITREVTGARASSSNCCLAVLDLDRFKSINDRFGHDVGDLTLRSIASVLSTHVRQFDFVGRLGGEEFGLCFPRTDIDTAKLVCERLLRAVRDEQIPLGTGTLQCTASIGLAQWRRNQDSIDLIVKRADSALYRAKQLGRDRTELDVEPTNDRPTVAHSASKDAVAV